MNASAIDEPRVIASGAVELSVPGIGAELVLLPASSQPLPVLIVTHGAGGTNAAHCALWGRISRGKAVLLCLKGRARGPNAEAGAYYPDHHALERETFAALAELRARFPARIAAGPVYYAGFSQGATMGSLMLAEHGAEVTRLALVEGGFADWNIPLAQAFRAGGGQRVLFVCGRAECRSGAKVAAHWLAQAGVDARVEYVAHAGHSHDARVEARIAQNFAWFIEGDPRWPSEP